MLEHASCVRCRSVAVRHRCADAISPGSWLSFSRSDAREAGGCSRSPAIEISSVVVTIDHIVVFDVVGLDRSHLQVFVESLENAQHAMNETASGPLLSTWTSSRFVQEFRLEHVGRDELLGVGFRFVADSSERLQTAQALQTAIGILNLGTQRLEVRQFSA